MSKKKKRGLFVALLLLLLLVVTAVRALDTRLIVRTYEIESEKVAEDVRVALITDLHCCDYGEGQRELMDAVEAQRPDIVLLAGDIIDDDRSLSWERGYATVEALAERWPTYYVTGNHELWTNEEDAVCAELEKRGAVVLRGETVSVAGLTLCGVDDPDVGENAWQEQLSKVSAALDGTSFSILLSHRPERVEDYVGKGFDLVVSGHAHGGQWRLPGIINGLIAPNQGLLPQYAGGQYALEDGTTMVVSRGLARESTWVPRIFNPPELVMIDVVEK